MEAGGFSEPQEATPKNKTQLNESRLEQFLQEKGFSARYNMLTHDIELDGLPDAYNPETRRQDFVVVLYDMLKPKYKCDRQTVSDLLSLIAGKNRYNPVLETIDSGVWDKQDRLQELINILGIQPGDTLSHTLLYKWLAQCYWMLRNDIRCAYGADGMLVLQGPQGIGKTTFVRVLGMKPEFVKLGQYIDPHDKDTIIRCTSAWISELGEIETTLKADIERLKAFITAERDEYRLPYGRADQTLARRTSLIGTCNTERFLIDPSGSRRFWTIPVESIDLDRLSTFDSAQLWYQIKFMCADNPNEFRLTQEERAQLQERNCRHEKPLPSQEELEDIFADAEADKNGYQWIPVTVSEFKTEYASLSKYSVQQIGTALNKLGYQSTRKKSNGAVSRVIVLPCHKWGITHAANSL